LGRLRITPILSTLYYPRLLISADFVQNLTSYLSMIKIETDPVANKDHKDTENG